MNSRYPILYVSMQGVPSPLSAHNPIEAIRTLAQEANAPAEDASIAQAILIGHRHRHPYYKHVIRRFESSRARKRLASLQDGGMRLLQYVHDAKVELKDYKVIHFVDLLRKLKPKVVYEFGAGGSTCLIAEILAENERKFGIHGELHSFEQSKDYYDRMTQAFPQELRPYITMHLCETDYKRDGEFRVLTYCKPALSHRIVDFAYIDGPDHIHEGSHYLDYPFHDGDLVELIRGGIQVRYAVNDVRWFNLGYFKQALPNYRFTIEPSHKAFFAQPR